MADGRWRAGEQIYWPLPNNDIAFNGTGISGATQSFTNNRISGNGTAGTAPTPIGATSTRLSAIANREPTGDVRPVLRVAIASSKVPEIGREIAVHLPMVELSSEP